MEPQNIRQVIEVPSVESRLQQALRLAELSCISMETSYRALSHTQHLAKQ